jgi:hypothetical protein
MAFAVHLGKQVGRATIDEAYHAVQWNGSAGSWVDLNPPNTQSQAYGVFQNRQVGEVIVNNNAHASIWTGTASSWVDLNHYLKPGYLRSTARAVWIDADFIYVAGHANNTTAGRTEAVMWIKSIGS